MKKLNLSEVKVKPKSGKSETRKRRKRRKRWNFFLSFRFWVLGQNRKVGREKAGKKFARFLTFPRFPSFWPGLWITVRNQKWKFSKFCKVFKTRLTRVIRQFTKIFDAKNDQCAWAYHPRQNKLEIHYLGLFDTQEILIQEYSRLLWPLGTFFLTHAIYLTSLSVFQADKEMSKT